MALDEVEVDLDTELVEYPFDRTGGELLFNFLAARSEKGSVIVTTKLAFSEWPQVFAGDETDRSLRDRGPYRHNHFHESINQTLPREHLRRASLEPLQVSQIVAGCAGR